MSDYPAGSGYPPQPRSALPMLLWILVFLAAMLAMPWMLEQAQFSLTRGRERAAAEVAREQLAAAPPPASVYRTVAKAVDPSVVGIQVLQRARGEDEWSHLLRGSPRMTGGEGSGVVVDAAGYIVTNFHVVDKAEQITLRLSDGRRVEDVELVGADPATDLAVLRIRAGGLIAAPWGDSAAIQVGDEVLAVGNPYGLERTVTAGIISAKGRRDIGNGGTLYRDFLQTDAAVNPGNSGGPLVNLRGEIVGINTAIVGPSFRGISFAIPSEIAKDVYERLKTTGTVIYGWLGVQLQELTDQTARQLGLREVTGALVAGVVPDGPAAAAGVEAGDVIVGWAGAKITSPSDLTFAVARTKIGQRVAVRLMRDAKSMEVTVTVAERPEEYRPGRRR